MERHLQQHRDGLLAATAKVLDSSQVIMGTQVRQFEDAWAKYTSYQHALGVNSGHDALVLALKAFALLVPKQSPNHHTIWLPAFTCPATLSAVMVAGWQPVLYDVDPSTALANPERLAAMLLQIPASEVPDAILMVTLFGNAVDWEPFATVLERYPRLALLEDNAQGHGLQTGLQKLPRETLAASATSFYPTKNLGAIGDAGAVVSNNTEVMKLIRTLREYGANERYNNELIGGNHRMDELQAAYLNILLPNLPIGNRTRLAHAQQYRLLLSGLSGVLLTPIGPAGKSNGHLVTLRARNRAELSTALATQGIGTAIHYPYAIHQMPVAKAIRLLEPLPYAEAWASQVLSLPATPYHTAKEIEQVCEAIRKSLA